MLGAIEAGGTKFVCAVANDDLKIVKEIELPTTHPEETFQKAFEFFDDYELSAIGIGSFGPIDIDETSDTYGYITSTPKPNWGNTDFVGPFKERYQIPVGWNTDVNAAALGEYELGADETVKNLIYLTVGTGVGGGAVVDGEILGSKQHPEMGHLLIRPAADDTYEGFCPYHRNCLEGMAAGPSIEKRLGTKAQDLPKDHPIWDTIADYLAQACLNYTMTLRPEQIILGGGVMKQTQLFPLIHAKFADYLNDYLETAELSTYIRPPYLDGQSGIKGSLLLAKNALENQ